MSTPKQNASLLDAALKLARLGLQVFPVYHAVGNHCSCKFTGNCARAGKHPCTRNGHHEATTDLKEIANWWRVRFPDANIGVRTGAESQIWVLDLDGPEGLKALARWEKDYGKLPLTPCVKTGGGGKHYYFKWRADAGVGSTTSIDGQRIDVRGEAGYVLVPPSNHRSGNVYEWEVSLDDRLPAQAPDWLLDKVRGKPTPMTGSLLTTNHLHVPTTERLDLTSDPGADEGERHSRATSLVGGHLHRGDGPETIKKLGHSWCEKCRPPMDKEEFDGVVESLAKKDALAASNAVQWELPTPFAENPVPPFPVEDLPDWLREHTEALAKAKQVPLDLPAMLSLTVVAAACARKVEVEIYHGYREPLNLFTAVAMRPGARKSTVFNEVTQPLREYEQEEARRLRPEVDKAESRTRIDETRRKHLETEAGKAKAEDQPAIVKELDTLVEAMAKAEILRIPRLLAADVTAEKLTTLLFENGGRMAVMSPEGEVFELMAGRYGKSGSANFGVYLNGHSGDDLVVDRVTRSKEFVKRPALTMGLAIQPDVVRQLENKPGFRGRGLLGRFLLIMPENLVGKRQIHQPAVPAAVRDMYRKNVRALLALPFATAGENGDDCHVIHFSNEALAEARKFEAWLEPQLAEGGELGHIDDWGGKLAGAVNRIASLLHLALYAEKGKPWEMQLDLATYFHAAKIGRYLIPHAKAAFAEMGRDLEIENTKVLLAWIERTGKSAFSRKDAFEGTKGRLKRVEELKPVLNLLVSHGYVRENYAQSQKSPGRPPSPMYEVNPLWISSKSRSAVKHSRKPLADSSAVSLNARTDDGEWAADVPTIAYAADDVSKADVHFADLAGGEGGNLEEQRARSMGDVNDDEEFDEGEL